MKQLLLPCLLLTQSVLGQAIDSTERALPDQPPKYTYSWLSDLNIGIAAGANNLPAYRAFLLANQIQSVHTLDGYLNVGFGIRYQRVRSTAANVAANFHSVTTSGERLLGR